MTTNSNGKLTHRRAELLRWHQRHIGLYARVAAKLGVSHSYVSLVVNGRRHSDKIAAAISEELERTLKAAPRGTRS
jgi:transcriptional regulator with XRE-family HTH domain